MKKWIYATGGPMALPAAPFSLKQFSNLKPRLIIPFVRFPLPNHNFVLLKQRGIINIDGQKALKARYQIAQGAALCMKVPIK